MEGSGEVDQLNSRRDFQPSSLAFSGGDSHSDEDDADERDDEDNDDDDDFDADEDYINCDQTNNSQQVAKLDEILTGCPSSGGNGGAGGTAGLGGAVSDFEIDTCRHGHVADCLGGLGPDRSSIVFAGGDDESVGDVAESYFDGRFNGQRRRFGGSQQRLVGSGGGLGGREWSDVGRWYGPVTCRCVASCLRSRPCLFFVYVVVVLVLLSSCVSLVLVGVLVAEPFARVSRFVNATCAPFVVTEAAGSGAAVSYDFRSPAADGPQGTPSKTGSGKGTDTLQRNTSFVELIPQTGTGTTRHGTLPTSHSIRSIPTAEFYQTGTGNKDRYETRFSDSLHHMRTTLPTFAQTGTAQRYLRLQPGTRLSQTGSGKGGDGDRGHRMAGSGAAASSADVILQTCSCGKGCSSKYRCVRIHIRHTMTSRNQSSVNAVLYEDETSLNRQCSYYPPCRSSRIENEQAVADYERRFGRLGTEYPCWVNPLTPTEVIQHHRFQLYHVINGIVWSSTLFILSAAFLILVLKRKGFCFRTVFSV